MRRARDSVNNRSLERGLQILRAFRPGGPLKSNSELAERTGLPRSTVSRLTQTLVSCGFLEHDDAAKAYRLGASILSLAETFITDSEVLPLAVPLMKALSDELRANIGLAVADGDEMVYLFAIRRQDAGMPRHRTTGYRVPTETTALGRAYLATLEPDDRERLLSVFRARHKRHWSKLGREIQQAVRQVQRSGYCRAEWLKGITAIAAPFHSARGITYVVNISLVTALSDKTRLRDELVPQLLKLAGTLRKSIADNSRASVKA